MNLPELKKIILEQQKEHILPDPCIRQAVEDQLTEFQKNKEKMYQITILPVWKYCLNF
jgi:hypothetical protein